MAQNAQIDASDNDPAAPSTFQFADGQFSDLDLVDYH
jgi:hypothetical protein